LVFPEHQRDTKNKYVVISLSLVQPPLLQTGSITQPPPHTHTHLPPFTQRNAVLLVNEDHKNRTMNFELMPNTRSGPLIKMSGEWKVMPLHHHLAESVAGLDGIEAMFQEYSVVRFQQKLLARLPRFSHSAFASFSKKAVQRTIDDLVKEIDNIKKNEPTLRPYAEVCKLEIERRGSVADLIRPGVEEEMVKGWKESVVANNNNNQQDPMSVLEDFDSDEKIDGSNSSGNNSYGSNMTQSSQSCPLSHKLLSLELVNDDEDEEGGRGSGGSRGSFKLGVVWGEREEKSLYNKTRDVCWQVVWRLMPSDGGYGVAAFI